MVEAITGASRAGYSDAPRGTERIHILTALVEDRPGAVDRVVGVLRRKRAQTLSLTLSPADIPDVVRITAQVKDSDVSVDNLVEHLRKVFDVRQVTNFTPEQAIVRELVLVRVNAASEKQDELTTLANQSGASVVDTAPDAITFALSGSEEQLTQFFSLVEPFGVREVARSGAIALPRGGV